MTLNSFCIRTFADGLIINCNGTILDFVMKYEYQIYMTFQIYFLSLILYIFSVQENLVGLNNQVLSEADSFKQEQSNINKLEKQAEDFLNVVFYRKGKTCIILYFT